MSLTLFYDGGCGLCHGAVRFVLKRDKAAAFRFAPLEGETFTRQVPAGIRGALPDSLVLRLEDGALLTRSAAVAVMLRHLGGGWAWAGSALRLIPPFLRDFAYDGVAKARHRLFRKPEGACPVVPPALRDRFLP